MEQRLLKIHSTSYAGLQKLTSYIELKGVGRNETKSMIDAMKRINGNNAKIRNMISTERAKILDYYDNHYGEIVTQAEQKASMQQYEEAIALTISVPSCSKGYKTAITAGLKYYAKYRDRYYLAILNRAKAMWAAGQDQKTAMEIVDLIIFYILAVYLSSQGQTISRRMLYSLDKPGVGKHL